MLEVSVPVHGVDEEEGQGEDHAGDLESRIETFGQTSMIGEMKACVRHCLPGEGEANQTDRCGEV